MSTIDQNLLHDVTARAANDLIFRKRLLTGGAADAIYEVFGARLPHGHRIRFMERPAGIDTLVVLPEPIAEGELDDEDLEQAAGGDSPPDPTW
jgi:hypothetical protein